MSYLEIERAEERYLQVFVVASSAYPRLGLRPPPLPTGLGNAVFAPMIILPRAAEKTSRGGRDPIATRNRAEIVAIL